MKFSFALLAMLAGSNLGLFDASVDVGTVLHPGSAEFNEAKRLYTVTGSGENMWFGTDAFQFVWTRVYGDFDLTAEIAFPQAGGNNHRKAVLMVRQTLDADSVYADAALHGDGLTSLQFREEKGGNTHEVQANVKGPKRLRLAKRGDAVSLWVTPDVGGLQFAAGSPPITLKAPFYVGIGVCSHDKDVVETATFSNVQLSGPRRQPATLFSALEVTPVSSADRRAIYTTQGRIESPQWSADGESLTFRRGDKVEQVSVAGGSPVPVGGVVAAKDGPVPAPDGQSTAYLEGDKLVVKAADGTTKVIARGVLGAPAWSPDGKRLAYVSYHEVL